MLEIKPDQMFVAGDLADPHGTHKVCLDAVLAAIDEVKDEEWMKNCRVWMYRGAWAEWEMDHIEMAVPISPEELRFKRNAILKHQSQAESARIWVTTSVCSGSVPKIATVLPQSCIAN